MSRLHLEYENSGSTLAIRTNLLMSNFVPTGRRMVFRDRDRSDYRGKYIVCDLYVSTHLQTNEAIGGSLAKSDLTVIKQDQSGLSIRDGMLKLFVPVIALMSERPFEFEQTVRSRSGLKDERLSLREQLDAMEPKANIRTKSTGEPEIELWIKAKISYRGAGLMEVISAKSSSLT
jgi:hypothetical protein